MIPLLLYFSIKTLMIPLNVSFIVFSVSSIHLIFCYNLTYHLVWLHKSSCFFCIMCYCMRKISFTCFFSDFKYTRVFIIDAQLWSDNHFSPTSLGGAAHFLYLHCIHCTWKFRHFQKVFQMISRWSAWPFNFSFKQNVIVFSHNLCRYLKSFACLVFFFFS